MSTRIIPATGSVIGETIKSCHGQRQKERASRRRAKKFLSHAAKLGITPSALHERIEKRRAQKQEQANA